MFEFFSSTVPFIANPLCATDFKFLDNGSVTGTPWETMGNSVMTAERGAYQVVLRLGIGAAIVGLIIAGIMLAISRNSQMENQAKDQLKWVILGIIILTSAVSLVVAAAHIGSTIGSTI